MSEKHFEPAFVVIRIYRDRITTPKTEDELDALCYGTVSPLKVFWSRERAEGEAARLNELNGPKGCFYYVQHTRVERR